MEATSRVLDLIPTLLEKLPFQASDVSRITGVPLTKDPERSNAAYEIYRAESAKGPLTAVEVRQRQSPKPGKHGLVLLDVSDKACISQQHVQKRFGEKPDGLSVPTPHQPSDSPVYLTYKQSWGELRLGFAQTGSRCLVSIVLDATK